MSFSFSYSQGAGSQWQSLGGQPTTAPAIGRNADGRLELFIQGADNNVHHNWQKAPNSGWAGWQFVGGQFSQVKMAAATNLDGRLEFFARGNDHTLWHIYQTAPNNGWSGWESLGGWLLSDPAVGQNADGR